MSTVPTSPPIAAAVHGGWRDYLELTKPKVSLLIVFTAIVGMVLASPGWIPLNALILGSIGIAMASGSAAAFNHILDRRIDGQMNRTRRRPLPTGHLQEGHAIAFADIENRGQEDIFEEMGGAFVGDAYQSALYRNPGHPGHSITLKLVGVQSNRAAYGARIEVVFHENGRQREVFRTVGAVSSFGGNPTEQHIGVGAATRVDEIRIRWPASYAHEQVLRDLPVDQALLVREGLPTAQEMPRKAFTLGSAPLPGTKSNMPMHDHQ